MLQAGSAGVLPKVCLGRRKMQYGGRRGSFFDSIRSRQNSGAPRRFLKTCPEKKTFFFLLRKKMKGNFLYKNFIRPAGTD